MTSKRSLSIWAGLGAAGLGLSFLVVYPALAADMKADVPKEIATAEQHAGFAQAATELKMVHTHLHHTINCLVGPKGKTFDAKALNPCKDLGNGAIPDSTDAAQKKALQAPLDKARAGLKANELAAAQKDAGEVEAMLKKLM
jgi:hypothetical protein